MATELSIIIAARWDGYESSPENTAEDRLYTALENNCSLLEGLCFDYEVILADWSPINDYLIKHPQISKLFDRYNIKDLVITKEAIVKNGMNPDKFQEYFAKDAGCRAATKDNILITNHDILLPEETLREVKDLIDNDLGNNFYRSRYRNGIDLYNSKFDDSFLLCGFGGDFLLIKKELFPGYDETNNSHKMGRQGMMDGEILYKMHLDGIKMKELRGGYEHIEHTRNRVIESNRYNKGGYNNPENWGFKDFYKEEISPQLTIIKVPQTIEQDFTSSYGN